MKILNKKYEMHIREPSNSLISWEKIRPKEIYSKSSLLAELGLEPASMHINTVPHLYKRYFKGTATLSQCCSHLMVYWVEHLHGPAGISGCTIVFYFELDSLLLVFYDLIFCLIFTAYPTTADVSNLKQLFYFAMILWASKGLVGQFLTGAQDCYLLQAQLGGLPSWPLWWLRAGLLSLADSGSLHSLHLLLTELASLEKQTEYAQCALIRALRVTHSPSVAFC